MQPTTDTISVRLERRAAELAAHFIEVAHTRMAGVPVLNPALQVEAIGFEPLTQHDKQTGDEQVGDKHAGDEPATGLGILITPWFMNLLRLPLAREDSASGVGRTRLHSIGGQTFEFIGAHEPAIGAFAACSLFSPMFEFADQASARATAQAVLAELRGTAVAPVARAQAMPLSAPALVPALVPMSAPMPLPDLKLIAEAPPARRAFLFGRSAASARAR